MSGSQVRVKANRLPEGNAGRRRVDRYRPLAIHASQECGHQLTADTDAAKGPPNIEPPHAQGTGHDRLDRQSSDADEHATKARGEQRLASRSNRVLPASQSAARRSTCRNPSASAAARSASKPTGKVSSTASSSSGSSEGFHDSRRSRCSADEMECLINVRFRRTDGGMRIRTVSEEITKVGMKPSHPGEFIREEILAELGLSVARAAEILGVRRATLSDLVNCHAALSPEMALRIEMAFGVNMDMLLGMQAWFDPYTMRQRAGEIDVKPFNPGDHGCTGSLRGPRHHHLPSFTQLN
jgi:addiction module HigA family antidote